MHPLVKQAARGVATAIWRRELLLLSGEALRDTVRELIFLGVLIHERGGDATELFALVESEEVIRALDRANACRVLEEGDRSARATKQFTRFSGERVVEAVPRVSAIRLEELGARRFAGLKLR